MELLDDEILRLWHLLNEKDVAYIMVGGFATNLHGFQRTTADINIWIKDTIENRKKLRAVLKDLEIGDFENIETTQFVPGFSSIMLNSGFELDIMTFIKGFDQLKFDECYKFAPKAIVEGIPVKFLHINQLIEDKKATARPKDFFDVGELEKIRKSTKR